MRWEVHQCKEENFNLERKASMAAAPVDERVARAKEAIVEVRKFNMLLGRIKRRMRLDHPALGAVDALYAMGNKALRLVGKMHLEEQLDSPNLAVAASAEERLKGILEGLQPQDRKGYVFDLKRWLDNPVYASQLGTAFELKIPPDSLHAMRQEVETQITLAEGFLRT